MECLWRFLIKLQILPNNIRALSVVFIHGIKLQILPNNIQAQSVVFIHGIKLQILPNNIQALSVVFIHGIKLQILPNSIQVLNAVPIHGVIGLIESVTNSFYLFETAACSLYGFVVIWLNVLSFFLLLFVLKYIFASFRTPRCPHSWLGIMHQQNVHYYYHYY